MQEPRGWGNEVDNAFDESSVHVDLCPYQDIGHIPWCCIWVDWLDHLRVFVIDLELKPFGLRVLISQLFNERWHVKFVVHLPLLLYFGA